MKYWFVSALALLAAIALALSGANEYIFLLALLFYKPLCWQPHGISWGATLAM